MSNISQQMHDYDIFVFLMYVCAFIFINKIRIFIICFLLIFNEKSHIGGNQPNKHSKYICKMISASDIRSYFQALPRNFLVEINGVSYKCNKFCLISFSTVLKNLINTDNSIKVNDLLKDAPNDKIKNIIEFIHGQESFDETKLSSFDDIFSCYFISASLGISIVKNRLCTQLTSLINADNVEFIYKKLSSFPDFYEPLTRFFNNNSISFFENFIKNNIFSSKDNHDSFMFLNTFLSNSSNVFQKEDEKLNLVRSIYEKAKNDDSLLLYNCIDCEKLSQETLKTTFIQIPLEEGKFIRCFKLISMLVNEKIKTIDSLRREKNRLLQLNNDLQDEKNKHSDHKSLISMTSSRISLAIQTEAQIKEDASELADKIELLSADVALIPVQNETTIRFLQNVNKMNDISKELNNLMQYFYENFGWLLWPGSSVSTMNDAKSLAELMTDLEKIVSGFRQDQDLLCVLSQVFANSSRIIRKALT